MKVLHVTDEQWAQINGYEKGGCILDIIKDGSGRYTAVVECKTYPLWEELWPIFNQMEEIDYTPLPEPE